MKTKKNRILNIIFLCLISFLLFGCNHSPAERIVSIENGKIKLGFDRNTGAFLVFRDLVNSHEFLDTNIIPGSLWEVDFLNSSEIETIDMDTPSEFHFSKRNPSKLILIWDNFSGIDNKDFTVTAVITLENNKPLSTWEISVEGTEGEKVNRVVFLNHPSSVIHAGNDMHWM